MILTNLLICLDWLCTICAVCDPRSSLATFGAGSLQMGISGRLSQSDAVSELRQGYVTVHTSPPSLPRPHRHNMEQQIWCSLPQALYSSYIATLPSFPLSHDLHLYMDAALQTQITHRVHASLGCTRGQICLLSLHVSSSSQTRFNTSFKCHGTEL